MGYSLSINSNEVVGKVYFVIFTVNKNIHPETVQLSISNDVCSNEAIVYLYRPVIFFMQFSNIKHKKAAL